MARGVALGRFVFDAVARRMFGQGPPSNEKTDIYVPPNGIRRVIATDWE